MLGGLIYHFNVYFYYFFQMLLSYLVALNNTRSILKDILYRIYSTRYIFSAQKPTQLYNGILCYRINNVLNQGMILITKHQPLFKFMFKAILYILFIETIRGIVPINLNLSCAWIESYWDIKHMCPLVYSPRRITCIIVVALYMFTGLFLSTTIFILENLTFLFLAALASIFIECFMLNFYEKHFIFKSSNNFLKNIYFIFNNIKLVLFKLIKLMLIGLMLKIFVRTFINTFMQGEDNFTTHTLVILLSMPICYYIMNFIIKIIRKEKISDSDMSIYNIYVATRVNIYNTLRLIFISFIYTYFGLRNAYELIAIIVILIIAIVVIIYYTFIKGGSKAMVSNKREPRHESAQQATFTVVTSGKNISALMCLTACLQSNCTEGYLEYNTLGPAQIPFKQHLFSNTPYTSNIINGDPGRTAAPDYAYYKFASGQPTNQTLNIGRSPILNIVHSQCFNMMSLKEAKASCKLTPVCLFANEHFTGSVVKAKPFWGEFKIITFIEEGNTSTNFFPSFYAIYDVDPDKSYNIQLELETRYGIDLGRKAPKDGIIILTQGTPLSRSDSLYKVWRPHLGYIAPNAIFKSLEKYYNLAEEEEEENISPNDPSVFKYHKHDIKKATWDNLYSPYYKPEKYATLKEIPVPDSDLTMSDATNVCLLMPEKVLANELKADKLYREMIDQLLLGGLKRLNSQLEDKAQNLRISRTNWYPNQHMVLNQLNTPKLEHGIAIIDSNYNIEKLNSIMKKDFKPYFEYGDRSDYMIRGLNERLPRAYAVFWQMTNPYMAENFVIRLHEEGVIEGYETNDIQDGYPHRTSRGMFFNGNPRRNGRISGNNRDYLLSTRPESPYYVRSIESRERFKYDVINNYQTLDNTMLGGATYGICITKLSFELACIDPSPEEFEIPKYAPDITYHAIDPELEEFKFYSIIDTDNTEGDSYTHTFQRAVKRPLWRQIAPGAWRDMGTTRDNLETVTYVVHKQDYNIFNYRDECTIRKYLDVLAYHPTDPHPYRPD